MKDIRLLDCTLRDGGYCNQWAFGFDNTQKIINSLVEADVDIIECGFITNRVLYDPNVTKYTSLDQITTVIPSDKSGKMFVAMMNYGEYDIASLPEYDGTSIDGIRVAFHKKDRFDALKACEEIKNRGYKVFIQAMVSLSYSDEEFLEMIHIVNTFSPYAFYIVDSFGMMKGNDLTRLFYLVAHNLNKEIFIGFHSHNNMQLAYSNAQRLCSIQTNREIIIDSSVYGMGRGAGNLNTELFVEYLTQNFGKNYQLNPLLEIIDKVLAKFYASNYWGYSLPNYLSAAHNAHPNYAGYLDDKKTLTVKDMNNIFELMDPEKKVEFDRKYIETLYVKYMETGRAQKQNVADFQNTVNQKTVLLIAPGKSASLEKEKIAEFCQRDDVVSISINFDYQFANTDYIFLSNLRRYRDLDLSKKSKCIVTSNIPLDDAYLQVDYKELLNSVEPVSDNAGLMMIKLLIQHGCPKVILAGFDGYSHESKENYADSEMAFMIRNAVLDATNLGMNTVLADYSQKTQLEFLTKQKYLTF